MAGSGSAGQAAASRCKGLSWSRPGTTASRQVTRLPLRTTSRCMCRDRRHNAGLLSLSPWPVQADLSPGVGTTTTATNLRKRAYVRHSVCAHRFKAAFEALYAGATTSNGPCSFESLAVADTELTVAAEELMTATTLRPPAFACSNGLSGQLEERWAGHISNLTVTARGGYATAKDCMTATISNIYVPVLRRITGASTLALGKPQQMTTVDKTTSDTGIASQAKNEPAAH